ncbi:MAG: hypothetical protein J6K92_07155 [Oscillospiraceae bacterium]|nr:hypothetical protein [Oscillospiraceae bacterium]
MKLISDIRIYKSNSDNVDGASLPAGFADKKLNAVIRRIVMKLRENDFSLGEFTHLYINLTTCSVDGNISPAKRSVDRYNPWYRYYDVNISGELFAKLGVCEVTDEIAGIICDVLVKFFLYDRFDKDLICSCISEAVNKGEKMCVKFKEKQAAKSKAEVFLFFTDSCRYLPLLRVSDAEGRIIFEEYLPESIDLNCIGEICLSSKKVTVKPRKNAFTEGIEPISFDLK